MTSLQLGSDMHIDIPALLASSSLPTEAESAYLNQLLETSNDEISRLTAAIDKLVLEREALKRNVTSYKAILAPIRRLPEDMLREIFVSCLPYNKAMAPVITDAPLLLGRVCRSWRELSLSTPALWASIHVQFSPFIAVHRVRRLCEEAHVWIRRSGTFPLTIGVKHGNCEDPLVIEFTKSLIRLSTRWRSMEITSPLEWLSSLTSLSKRDVPRLEKFSYSLTGAPPTTESGDVWQSLDILGGERLHDVSVQNLWFQSSVTAISKLNLGQLTRLILFAGSESTLMYAADILRRCPNLRVCRLSLAMSHIPGIAPDLEPMNLLHLSSLSLILGFSAGPSPDPLVVEEFFSKLNLPRLTSFDHNLGASSITSWTALGRTSPIENLALSLSDLRYESVQHYLRTSTCIKWLRITRSYTPALDDVHTSDMDDLALLMDIGRPSDVLCPFLQVLELQSFTLSEEIFVQLVRRRASVIGSDGIAHLKVVCANFFSSNVDIQVISQLEDLMSAGLSLFVSYRPFRAPQNPTHYWPYEPNELEWPM
ncbi:hypothetical protein C8J56DRAFT_478909 [Mycena floridula]|nr:hypothetical protein C8J56DRAFT_478909 [Mycena floridula]